MPGLTLRGQGWSMRHADRCCRWFPDCVDCARAPAMHPPPLPLPLPPRPPPLCRQSAPGRGGDAGSSRRCRTSGGNCAGDRPGMLAGGDAGVRARRCFCRLRTQANGSACCAGRARCVGRCPWTLDPKIACHSRRRRAWCSPTIGLGQHPSGCPSRRDRNGCDRRPEWIGRDRFQSGRSIRAGASRRPWSLRRAWLFVWTMPGLRPRCLWRPRCPRSTFGSLARTGARDRRPGAGAPPGWSATASSPGGAGPRGPRDDRTEWRSPRRGHKSRMAALCPFSVVHGPYSLGARAAPPRYHIILHRIVRRGSSPREELAPASESEVRPTRVTGPAGGRKTPPAVTARGSLAPGITRQSPVPQIRLGFSRMQVHDSGDARWSSRPDRRLDVRWVRSCWKRASDEGCPRTRRRAACRGVVAQGPRGLGRARGEMWMVPTEARAEHRGVRV